MEPRVFQFIAIGLFVVLLSMLPASASLAQNAIRCTVESDQEAVHVVVQLTVPHADKMLLVAPDGRRIYLRDGDIPSQHPLSDQFRTMREFVIDDKTPGTWFNDWGETEIVKAFGIAGKYELLIADDLEEKTINSNSMRCTFLLES